MENNEKSMKHRYLKKHSDGDAVKGKSSKAVLSSASSFNYVEAYKSLRTSLTFLAGSKNIRRIVVTSAVPSEGKSTVSVNLALTLAEAGHKVILIDCDMRRPSLNRYLGVGSGGLGLSSVLGGMAEEADVIRNLDRRKIDFISAGVVPPNPSELLASPRMGELTTSLAEKYDFVILDSPPVSVVTDAAVLSPYSDGTILTVRHRFAPRSKIIDAKKSLEAVDARILGVVLNGFNFKQSTKSYDYYSSSYDYRSKKR